MGFLSQAASLGTFETVFGHRSFQPSLRIISNWRRMELIWVHAFDSQLRVDSSQYADRVVVEHGTEAGDDRRDSVRDVWLLLAADESVFDGKERENSSRFEPFNEQS